MHVVLKNASSPLVVGQEKMWQWMLSQQLTPSKGLRLTSFETVWKLLLLTLYVAVTQFTIGKLPYCYVKS